MVDDSRSRDDSDRSGRSRGAAAADLAASDRFSTRIFSNLVQLIASSVGERGGDISWLAGVLGQVEALVGPAGMRGLAALAAASIQTPESAKRVLRSIGVPEEFIAMADEAIDSFIHGLSYAQTKRGKITEKDLSEASKDAHDKLATNLNKKVTFAEGLAILTFDQQTEYRTRYNELVAEDAAIKDVGKKAERMVEAAAKAAETAALAAGRDGHAAAGQARQDARKSIVDAARSAAETSGEDPDDAEAMARGKFRTQRDKFDAMRVKITGTRLEVTNQILALIRIPSKDWVGFLESIHGAEKPAVGLAKLSGVADKLTKRLADKVGKGIDKIVDNPEATMTDAAKSVDRVTSSVDGFRARMKARRLARGRTE